ncbi:MAG TPA: hypothetical protein DF364_07955, partial [Ruminococcaceae bacterium]|nr:hypothetical protein [Oscillospiraceae bacterium]
MRISCAKMFVLLVIQNKIYYNIEYMCRPVFSAWRFSPTRFAAGYGTFPIFDQTEVLFMARTELKKVFEQAGELSGQQITVCGWVKTIRDSKALGFIELNDGSTFANLQVVFE